MTPVYSNDIKACLPASVGSQPPTTQTQRFPRWREKQTEQNQE
jgi:hypothetical protein